MAGLISSCLSDNYAISRTRNKTFCCAVVECDSKEIADIVEGSVRDTMEDINHRPVADVILRARETPNIIYIIAHDGARRMDLILETALIDPFRGIAPTGDPRRINVSFAESYEGDMSADEFYDRVLRSRTVLTY